MFCYKCGSSMDEDALFCICCGTPIRAKKEQGETDAQVTESYKQQNTFTQQQPFYYQTAYPTYINEPPKPFVSDKKDKLFILFAALLGFLFCELILFGGLGISVPVYVLIFYAFTMFYLRDKEKKPNKASLWLFIPIALISICFGLYSNGLLQFFNVLLLFTLIVLQLSIYAGVTRYPLFSIGTIADFFSTSIALPFSNLHASFQIMSEKKTDKSKSSTFLKVCIGLVIIIPVAAIIISLLDSADLAFDKVVSGINDVLFNRLGEYVWKIILGVFIGIPLFGGLYALRYKRKHNLDKKVDTKLPSLIDTIIINTALGVIVGIYAIYLLSQIQYFFSGFTSKLPGGFTLAEYARKGFFELVAVVVINLALIGIAILIAKKKEGQTKKSVKAFVCAISLFTILLISSAISKMVLYVHYFGLTLFRVYAAWFMILLAIIFIAVLFKLTKDKFKIVRFICIASLVMYIGLNFVNVDALIPMYNISMYNNHSLKQLDTEAFTDLSDSMVPYVLPLLDNSDTKIADGAKAVLKNSRANIENGKDDKGNYPWQAFNISTWQAKTLIEQNRILFLNFPYK